MIAVGDFSSTQDYLIASFEQAKQLDSKVTVQIYAKRIGLGSSSLKMILSRKRTPTLHQMLSVARSQRLNSAEISYIETLSLVEMAKDDWEKAYFQKSLRAKKKGLTVATKQTSQTELLTDTLALPLLVDLLESKSAEIDLAYLAKRFNTSAEKIRTLVTDLQKNEVLQKKADGHFHVVFDKFGHKPLQKKYLQNLLSEASKKIESGYDRKDHAFVNYAINLTPEMLENLKIDIKQVMLKYMNQDIPATETRHIAQAGFQIYPITT